jgi:hypothetical protein
MAALVYAYVGPLHTQPYQKEFVAVWRRTNPGGAVVEVDQQSNPALFAAARQLMQQETNVVAVFDFLQAEGNETAPPVRQLIEALLPHKEKIAVKVLGHHGVLAPMLRFFKQLDA